MLLEQRYQMTLHFLIIFSPENILHSENILH